MSKWVSKKKFSVILFLCEYGGKLVLILISSVLYGLGVSDVSGAIWYVDNDAPGDPNPNNPLVSDPLEDGSPDHPFDAIQEGINSADPNDTVLVLTGTYTGTGNKNLNFAGKAITVCSIDPYNPNIAASTIIDCEGSGRGFYFRNNETTSSVLSGLTITNGVGTFVDIDGRNWKVGGAIFCSNSSPLITNCRLVNNSTRYGGGIFCHYSDAVIQNCLISNNYAANTGGGIGAKKSHVTVTNSTISGNTASSGGAIYAWYHYPSLSISNSIIKGMLYQV